MNFKHFLGLYREERIDKLIVCNIDPVVASAIGATVTRVFLSAETMAKQRLRHADLTPEDYRSLRPALLAGEYRQETPRSAMVLFVDSKLNDYGVRAYVKATENGREMYVGSFCFMRTKTFRQALANGLTVIRPHK